MYYWWNCNYITGRVANIFIEYYMVISHDCFKFIVRGKNYTMLTVDKGQRKYHKTDLYYMHIYVCCTHYNNTSLYTPTFARQSFIV